MDMYHILKYLVMIFQGNIRSRYLEKFLYHQMTSWAKGTTANSLFIVHALTTIFWLRERNRSRFASLHTMNG